MADCAPTVEIPPDPEPDLQHELWAADRTALVECGGLNRAKGKALDALGVAAQ